MDVVVKMHFGSQLYGTNTPNSDTDYKGIFLPSIRDCFCNAKIIHTINDSTGDNTSKNSKNDIDMEWFSIHKFIQMAKLGDTKIIDMIHAPKDMIIESSVLWNKLKYHKDLFYCKNMTGILGYIRTQADKYGIKGSRIAALRELKEILSSYDQKTKMIEIWDSLPNNEYCYHIPNKKDPTIPMYLFGNKQVGKTVTVMYTINIIDNILNNVGVRALQAERNEGIDWKAIHHALRSAIQLHEIYTTGNLVYPLKERKLLLDVKQGKYHFVNDGISEMIDSYIQKAKDAANKSDYPDKIEINKIKDIVYDYYTINKLKE